MREVVMMGGLGAFDPAAAMGAIYMGDSGDGGFFDGTPAGDAWDLIHNAPADAAQVESNPAALSQLSQATGVSKANILAAAQQATGDSGTGTKTTPGGGSSGYNMTTVSATASRTSTAAKVAGGALLAGAAWYVGKAKGWW